MTTRGRDNRQAPYERERERDERSYQGPRQGRRNLDEEVVALRERGESYSAVARALGLKRAVNAHEAFVRAMRRLPEPERRALGRRESKRLDELEVRIRSRDADQPAKMERHLAALDALRQTVLQV
ncbi:MAG TPA: hypothetical protein VEJ84_08865 [Acidimicrobiales bacterium]|nr:hypothetical protein [Acidimicrobiales bacterium]